MPDPILYRYWQPSREKWGYTEDGSVSGVEPMYSAADYAALTAELEALRRDAAQDKARLDWLEHMANKSGGLLLHDGSEKGRCGLGLRPGFLSRTLREAIDDSAGFDAARHQEATNGR